MVEPGFGFKQSASRVCVLTTILDLDLEEIRKDLIESVIGISPVTKGPILVEPNSIWVFVYFVVNYTSVRPALSSVVSGLSGKGCFKEKHCREERIYKFRKSLL